MLYKESTSLGFCVDLVASFFIVRKQSQETFSIFLSFNIVLSFHLLLFFIAQSLEQVLVSPSLILFLGFTFGIRAKPLVDLLEVFVI